MALDAEGYKSLIIDEVHDDDRNTLADNIDTLWLLYEDKTTLELQYLYTKRRAIDLLLGAVREKVTIELGGGRPGVQVDNNALSTNLRNMRVLVQAEIDEVEAGTNSPSRGWGKTPARA